MTNKTGYENLLKVLRKHIDHCKMHEFSLQENRHCTCGVEGARRELDNLVLLVNIADDVNRWLCKTDRAGTAHQRSLEQAIATARD